MVRGRSRHILGYLQDFLFEPKRARTPVKALSGARKTVYCWPNSSSNPVTC